MIEIQHLCKTYNASSDTAHHALDDVNLTINDGDIFGIIGASGAGKSTLVRCINLLERPTSGKILIDGRDVTDFSGKQLLEHIKKQCDEIINFEQNLQSPYLIFELLCAISLFGVDAGSI